MTGSDDRTALLQSLEEEEKHVSSRRRRLHDRIDFIRSGGGDYTLAAAEQLAVLEAQERELSARRRELHDQIDALRGGVRPHP